MKSLGAASRGQASGRTKKVPLDCPTFHLTPHPRHTHPALKTHGKFVKHLHEGDPSYPSSCQLLASSPNAHPTPAILSSSACVPPGSHGFPTGLGCPPAPPSVFPRSFPPSLAPAPRAAPGTPLVPTNARPLPVDAEARRNMTHPLGPALSPRPLRPGFVPLDSASAFSSAGAHEPRASSRTPARAVRCACAWDWTLCPLQLTQAQPHRPGAEIPETLTKPPQTLPILEVQFFP